MFLSDQDAECSSNLSDKKEPWGLATGAFLGRSGGPEDELKMSLLGPRSTVHDPTAHGPRTNKPGPSPMYIPGTMNQYGIQLGMKRSTHALISLQRAKYLSSPVVS